jgi:hypothetical protein
MMSGAGGTVKACTSRNSSPLTRSQNSPSACCRRAAAAEEGVESVVSMNAALTVKVSDASGVRLMNDCVWRSWERPPIGSSGRPAMPAGASAPTQ